MSGSSFRSVFMVASCAGAALGCYLVSLRVASERAALEEVETEIVMAQRDIRLLQTEIGTRGRLAQLERWNVKVLALSAPSADQFLQGGFERARLARPAPTEQLDVPVVLAAASADATKPTVQGASQNPAANRDEGVSARDLMQVASFKTQPRPSSSVTTALIAPAPKTASAAEIKPKAVAPAPRKLASNDAASKATKPGKPAKSGDPLAPLPSKPSPATAKESGKAR
jgi:hypothetical protein